MLQQPLFSIIGWVIFRQLWAAHLMKQRRKPMNKKLAQPSCYMLTVFLPLLFHAYLFKIFLFLPLYPAGHQALPSTLISLHFPSRSRWDELLLDSRMRESCLLPPAMIPGSSASYLSLWRGVRVRAKSSIASGEFRGDLHAADKFSFTPSLLSSLDFGFHLCCHSWGNRTHSLPLENILYISEGDG